MDKQACKSITCHADNITDEISPLALSFNFTETFVERLARDVLALSTRCIANIFIS